MGIVVIVRMLENGEHGDPRLITRSHHGCELARKLDGEVHMHTSQRRTVSQFLFATFSLVVLLMCATPAAHAQLQLINNGGFESGLSNWTALGHFYADAVPGGGFPHSGNRYLYLSNPDQTAGNNLNGTCYQQFTIPSNATAAVLSYWWNVSSQEGTSQAFDFLNVTLQSSSGSHIATLEIYSNQDQSSPGDYEVDGFDLSAFKGQTIRLHFLGTTDGSLPTVFRVDDVKLEVTLPGTVSVNPTSITRTVTQGQNASSQSLTISNSGGWAGINYSISDNQSWLSVSPSSGSTVNVPQDHTVNFSTAGLSPGNYSATITISAPGATNPTTTVPVSLTVNSSNPGPGPFTLSNQAPVCDENPPVAPAVTLNWTSSAGATQYHVYRNGSFYADAGNSLRFYNSANVVAGQSYTYFIRAINANGTTDSNQAAVDIPSNICDGIGPIADPPNDGNPNSFPDYGSPIESDPRQDKLILVTHGWNTDSDALAFWTLFTALIEQKTSDDWDVEFYSWVEDSGSSPFEVTPDEALDAGITHGYAKGIEIANMEYTHVHLIGHSAGSALIAAAAEMIDVFAPNTKVHTTYLDAYAGTFLIIAGSGYDEYQAAYGGNAVWSDHYFSKDATGSDTELDDLINCHSVDVTLLDPNVPSTHSWPYEYYLGTMLDGYEGTYGWPLSYEAYLGSFESWLNSVAQNEEYGPNPNDPVILPTPAGVTSGAQSSQYVWQRYEGPIINLSSIQSVSSSEEVEIDGLTFSAFAPEAEGGNAGSAWVNFQIVTEQPVNFIAFDLEFTSNSPSPEEAGLVTLYVDGIERGVVDERYTVPGKHLFSKPTPGELTAGTTHILGFRLDNYGSAPSTVRVSDVRAGWAGFVPNIQVPADHPTVQAAIQSAPQGAIINIAPGTYSGNIEIDGRAVTLRALGNSSPTIIDAQGIGSVLSINNSSVTIEGVTVRQGGGTVDDGTTFGGGLLVWHSSASLVDCVIESSTADWGAGLHVWDSALTMRGCTVRGNEALQGVGGGAVILESTAVLTNCAFEQNAALGFSVGGAAMIYYSDAVLESCEFIENSAREGAGLNLNVEANVSLIECVFESNSAEYSGGGLTVWGNVDMEFCNIRQNDAGAEGGGLWIGSGWTEGFEAANVHMIDSTCIGNSSELGAGIAVVELGVGVPSLHVENTVVGGNVASTEGGGLYITGDTNVELFMTEMCGNFPESIVGSWIDLGSNVFLDECRPSYSADINGDGLVDEQDRVLLCGAMGSLLGDAGYLSPADFNEDGEIDYLDLALFNAELPPCSGDIVTNATLQPPPDGVVDGADLAYLLGAWGPQSSCADLVANATLQPPPDGIVDGADLAVLLGAWGACN